MKFLKKPRLFMVALLIIIVSIALAAFPGRSQNYPQASEQKNTKTKNQPDNHPGPVVDYDSSEPVSPLAKSGERTLREIRSNRYNGRAPQPFGELPPDTKGFGIQSDLTTLLPSLPVKQSDAILIGEVIDAKAYLSNDKTGVYSEFTIRVDGVLKNSSVSQLTSSAQVVAEREGGVVRFSSGRLLQYAIYNQGLPRSGQRYVFFLKRNEQGQDYFILTGYALHKGRVSPLDIPEQFAAYEGTEETVFINEVQQVIANSSDSK